MSEPLLETRALSVRYGGAVAVDRASLAVDSGEVVGLLGANGAGKSSLLRALIGLAATTAGEIRFGGTDLAAMPPHRRARLGIGYAPEGRRVFAGLTTEDNLLVASRDPGAARARRAEEMYELFPLLGERRRARAWQLSGGEQQMLAIARALMARPRLLLVDEPTLGLAPALADVVVAALRDIAGRGAAVLLAEQNARAGLAASDRVLLMRLGRIEVEGSGEALAHDERLRRIMMGG